jgi:hypothetical protein
VWAAPGRAYCLLMDSLSVLTRTAGSDRHVVSCPTSCWPGGCGVAVHRPGRPAPARRRAARAALGASSRLCGDPVRGTAGCWRAHERCRLGSGGPLAVEGGTRARERLCGATAQGAAPGHGRRIRRGGGARGRRRVAPAARRDGPVGLRPACGPAGGVLCGASAASQVRAEGRGAHRGGGPRGCPPRSACARRRAAVTRVCRCAPWPSQGSAGAGGGEQQRARTTGTASGSAVAPSHPLRCVTPRRRPQLQREAHEHICSCMGRTCVPPPWSQLAPLAVPPLLGLGRGGLLAWGSAVLAASDVTSFELRAHGPGGPVLLYTTTKNLLWVPRAGGTRAVTPDPCHGGRVGRGCAAGLGRVRTARRAAAQRETEICCRPAAAPACKPARAPPCPAAATLCSSASWRATRTESAPPSRTRCGSTGGRAG